MYAEEDLPAGWLTQFRRGVFSGAGLLLLAVAASTVPAFLVWLVPGADTTPATSAVKAAALVTLSAAHGGLRLDGDSVTLVPLLVTGLLGWLVAGQARRSESVSAVVGLSVGYGVASGALAHWAELGSTRAPSLRSALAGFAFVLVVGGLARAADSLWPRLSFRHRRIMRATTAVLACYCGAAALLVAGSLIWHLHAAASVQASVAPGASGLPVALLGLAATPNAVLAGVAYLTGAGVQLGQHTSVSLAGVQHGPLPAFPLTAAVPGHASTLAGVLLMIGVAILAGWSAVRLVAAGPGRQRLLDAAAAAVLAGGILAAATGLASGGIGAGALAHVGSSWWAVGGGVLGLVSLAAGLCGLLARWRPELIGAGAGEPAADRPRLRSIAGSGSGAGENKAAAEGQAGGTTAAARTAGKSGTAKDRHVS